MTDLDALWRAARKLGSRRRSRKTLPPLLFFTDPARTPFPEHVLAQLPRGSAIVFRAFGDPDALAKARRLAQFARRRGVWFFVGADVNLAIRARADGVHLPERLAHRGGCNRRLRQRFLLTAAAHGLPAARLARRAGVEAIVLSPVFPSASPSAGRPLGVRRFAVLVRAAGAPCYALGGVNAHTVRALWGSGAVGAAAVGALTQAGTRRP
ncbi:MAG: thiE [Caulobacteraceae bacterium]|jgi:thiamine-phosphate pyrophosphorylase|nr:thiE [Caulobacteraceae bacterium]